MALHKITEFHTEWFSICTNITSKFHTIAIPKSSVEQNNDSHITCTVRFQVLMAASMKMTVLWDNIKTDFKECEISSSLIALLMETACTSERRSTFS
jgi:hypothetical protein